MRRKIACDKGRRGSICKVQKQELGEKVAHFEGPGEMEEVDNIIIETLKDIGW